MLFCSSDRIMSKINICPWLVLVGGPVDFSVCMSQFRTGSKHL
jgi:hypothetical protein